MKKAYAVVLTPIGKSNNNIESRLTPQVKMFVFLDETHYMASPVHMKRKMERGSTITYSGPVSRSAL
jgi:hypothetical protein